MFDTNVSGVDRLVRASAGTALLATGATLCVTGRRPFGALSALAGLILLGTAGAGWCPIYKTLGISTVK
jgi:hypothetical protein